jgi:hypothetical protein
MPEQSSSHLNDVGIDVVHGSAERFVEHADDLTRSRWVQGAGSSLRHTNAFCLEHPQGTVVRPAGFDGCHAMGCGNAGDGRGRREETQLSRGRLSPYGPHGPFRNPGFEGSAGMIKARWGNVVRAIYEDERS